MENKMKAKTKKPGISTRNPRNKKINGKLQNSTPTETQKRMKMKVLWREIEKDPYSKENFQTHRNNQIL